ncbi:2-amino-4-hydroxy-6-hydroxymethyldihydropteridine diphosphokinase [Cognatiluteimonas profundi]|uniref:2-amino-4-hydroxy-6- hydroxymethyldihydropteridine diphosphokinase n=1 Tax=Cognatiluteimonas profundi TaxID=2594501 RepID=UPI001E3746AB|nr:2-amino-4-hydroxy-6-hydroxymethyldihydropteridine diphosphokinase [Lysobacter profundi]
MRAWVGLGGNTGDPVAILRAAIVALDKLPDTRLLRSSQLYRSPAWGPVAQADFINAVALLETSLDAPALLDGMLGIERAFGRERQERWGPRSLDLDLLLYGDRIIDVPGLRVPHPQLHERAFMLVPLLELDPQASIPGVGSARDALAALASGGVEVVG